MIKLDKAKEFSLYSRDLRPLTEGFFHSLHLAQVWGMSESRHGRTDAKLLYPLHAAGKWFPGSLSLSLSSSSKFCFCSAIPHGLPI
jgi:hypothetical protein